MILRSNSLLLSPILAPLLMLLLWSGCGGNGHDEGPRFSQENMSSQLVLKEDWAIQSAAEVPENGEVISTAGFSPQNWFPTSVPSTVLAALVENNVYPDPYFAMNLRSIPGTTYPLGVNFSNFPIPLDSPFRSSWWYRTEFFLPEDYSERTIYLHFNGINFRANIWVNGILIADSKKVAGTYRVYEFNITSLALPGEANCLAVEVFPPKVLDLAHTWVDWNPMPPDKDMGIWREAYLTTSGPVALRDTQVITDVDTPSLKAAHLTIYTEVLNTTDQPLKGTLQGDIEGIEFSRTVDLGPQESRRVTFSPEESSQLTFSRPRVWWPAQLGSQPLYELEMAFELDGKVSDRRSVRFGIREVSSDLNEHGYRLFKINGENILIRGAGWTPDMMFRSSPEREETEIRYVRDLNLNAIRLEGKLGSDHLLDLCDTYGILVIAGWCCCDQWERWFLWDDEDYTVAAESLKSQILRLRNHPSLIAWLNGSDSHPPQDVEQMYIDILESDTFRWPNPYLASAAEEPSALTGETGVKMTGPYEYVPPVYWYADTTSGGAFGFNTETSPGPAVPPLESLQKMLPEEHLWPIDGVWNYHAGGGSFQNIEVFTQALDQRYGPATGIEDYTRKAQAMTYESQRAMFEAYTRNKYGATGVIQWMLNDAWPSIIWHLYDYYLRPGGGYFGTKKACEPLHIQYSYDDRSVVVANAYYRDFRNMKATARVNTLDMTEVYSREATLDIAPDSSTRVFVIPELQGLGTTFFLKLSLEDPAGLQVSSNFYWLSTQPDVLAWNLGNWYYTPILSYGDLTALQGLPMVELGVSGRTEHGSQDDVAHVTLENPTLDLAFLVHLQILQGMEGEEVLPIFWQDNYFSLMPGERREISATYRRADVQGPEAVLKVDGWNIVPRSLSIPVPVQTR